MKWTTNSAVLLPSVGPACDGPLIELMVPPQIVRRRSTPEYPSASRDGQTVGLEPDRTGTQPSSTPGIDGHIDETPPPLAPQIGGDTQPS